jgi:hypothetical protein
MRRTCMTKFKWPQELLIPIMGQLSKSRSIDGGACVALVASSEAVSDRRRKSAKCPVSLKAANVSLRFRVC